MIGGFANRIAWVDLTAGEVEFKPVPEEDARKYIAGYKVPRELHLVDEVPRAPSGKPAYPKALEIALAGNHRLS